MYVISLQPEQIADKEETRGGIYNDLAVRFELKVRAKFYMEMTGFIVLNLCSVSPL